MNNRRQERVAASLLRELTRFLQTEPLTSGLPPLTITHVSLNADLAVANVRWSTLLPADATPRVEGTLRKLAPQMRGPIGRALGLRHSPELRFELDKNVLHVARIDELLASLPPAAGEPPAEPAAEDPDPSKQ